MPSTTYYLNKEVNESIGVTHGFNFKDLTISYNGQILGSLESKEELRAGQSFALPDNRVVTIQLKRRWGIQEELEILLDGIPVSGSNTDPAQVLKQVMHILYFLVAVNAGLGVVAEFTQYPFLLNLGLGAGSIVVGIVYSVLAYFIKTRLMAGALYAAIGLLALDGMLILVFAAESPSSPVTGILIKLFFIFTLFKGIPALKRLKTERLAQQQEAVV